MTTGTEDTTCGQGREGSSLPSMPMRSSANPKNCWVSREMHTCILFHLTKNFTEITFFLSHIGMKRNPAWIETFNVQFLGSVEVPYHQGNGILCAAMQKVRKVYI